MINSQIQILKQYFKAIVHAENKNINFCQIGWDQWLISVLPENAGSGKSCHVHVINKTSH